MANILIVEDEKPIRDILADYLHRAGHVCVTAEDGVDALVVMKNNPVDLVILDVMMPHMDGFTVCRAVRETEDVPIMMLTAKSEEADELKGYELGADDYVTKPFSPRVVVAKANALLRRSSIAEQELIEAGKIMLRPKAKQAFLDGRELSLTHKEYELLEFLMANPEQVFSREQLLNRVWGFNFEGMTRTVDTHVKTLRHKLGDERNRIVTLIRSGYKFEARS